ncbi:hypothetical protein [Carboxylicivirga linearis]|uniref:Uncharacterized protein n=1 Tax=Carboxylicivirga linearis TaxID=1628157 RepID=A0ABS5JW61_9BACT|nr:hypothetical protein [Carboxylicivirga linearis]MBS2099137.1 hypothetical protein [Carboxylicivirga linearis]
MQNLINESLPLLRAISTKLESSFNPNGQQVNLHEKIILDLILKYRKNLAIIILGLEHHVNDSFITIGLSNNFRVIAADTLTLAYMLSFLSPNIEDEQIAFRNEVNALNNEFIHQKLEIFRVELGKELADKRMQKLHPGSYKQKNKNTILKNRDDFHLHGPKERYKRLPNYPKEKSPDSIISNCLASGAFLTERSKFKRLKEVTNFSSSQNVYINYKYFSMFYHYTPVAGDMARKYHEIFYKQSTFCILNTVNIILTCKPILSVINDEAFNDLGKLHITFAQLAAKYFPD